MSAESRQTSLYDADYQLWLAKTLEQLQAGDFDNIDLENLIEELESLGKSEKRAILSYLMRLCEHLLKLKYWQTERERCGRGWKLEIRNFRIQIRALLRDSPSLSNHLRFNFLDCYQNGRKLFLDDSELDAAQIPAQPWFTLEQALDEDWLPESA
ncbi:MAG: DUF29 domain-containing protein [Elainella sp.]